jgi:peptidyl-prolyl cis-trans isomerase A (cyclophilin A)
MRKTLFVAVLLCFALSCFAQNKGNQPQAILETSLGTIHCTLFPDKAPTSVANFIGLADGTKDWTDPATHQKKHGVPLYDGTIFHRVIPGFMIQGGDPAGNGTGDPGYGFGLEVTPDLKFDRPGRLAYARTSDPNTNGSQFFITADKSASLDGQYTIFGQCENLDVVQKIINGARDRNDRPYSPARITHITIVKSGQGK